MNKKIITVILFIILFSWYIVHPVSVQTATGGYPRIFNLWGGYSYGADNAYFAGFNLYATYNDGSRQVDRDRADAIHLLNPNTKILITADIIPAHDPGQGLDVQPQWWSAQPGTPDYACILRDSNGHILRDATYDAAYNNLTNSYCRDVLVNYFINRWNSSGGHFDGWQVDQAGDGGVSLTLGNNIDANVDGVPDDIVGVNANYVAGMIDIFTRLRNAFPNIIIHANDSPSYYGQWVNGRLFEMDLKRHLDKNYSKPWPEIIKDWSSWTVNQTNLPNTTGMMNSPDGQLISAKYNFENIWTAIKPEMMVEYSADYNRMRFGLVSAMMAGGMYDYDLASYMYGINWWYDEYGTRGNISSLGYLGQPTDTPKLISQITTPDQAVNGDFSAGTEPWFSSTSGTNVIATYTVENGVAHLHLPGAASGWVIFRENYVTVEAGKYYTVSFRAKANASRYGGVRIQRAGGAWEYLASAEYQIHFYPDWTQYNLTLKATGSGTNGSLMFDIGVVSGDIYFDDIKFQEGTGGVWQRHFDKGTVLLNEGPLPQTIALDKTYKKLTGNQAPLYFQRIDDDKAVVSGAWSVPQASFDQWGLTVHSISAPDNTATMTYAPSLAYDGQYEVLAWVAPDPNYSKTITVTIHHAAGDTPVTLDETAGALGWHSLGTYNFTASGNPGATLTATGTGTVIADAFKWVSTARYNDGSVINNVTLQPDDAIILLNSSQTVPSPSALASPQPSGGGGSADINKDGIVDAADLILVLQNWLGISSCNTFTCDLNSDSKINAFDATIVIGNWGR